MLFLHLSACQIKDETLAMFLLFVEECRSYCTLGGKKVTLNHGIRAGSVWNQTLRKWLSTITGSVDWTGGLSFL